MEIFRLMFCILISVMEAFNGLAHLGTDFDINNLVSISLGPHSNQHIPVTILNNALVECDKEFYVEISGIHQHTNTDLLVYHLLCTVE